MILGIIIFHLQYSSHTIKKYKEKDILIISDCVLRLSALVKHKSELARSLFEIFENTKQKVPSENNPVNSEFVIC